MKIQLLLTFICLLVEIATCLPVDNSTTGTADATQDSAHEAELREQFAKEERERVQKQKDEAFKQQLRREEQIRQENQQDVTSQIPFNRPSIQQRSDDTETLLKSFSALLQPKIMGSDATGKLMPVAQPQTVANSQMTPLQSQPIPQQQQGTMPQQQAQPATGQAATSNDVPMEARMGLPAGYGYDGSMMQPGAAQYPYQQGALPMGRTLAEQQQLQQLQNDQLARAYGAYGNGAQGVPLYYGNQLAG